MSPNVKLILELAGTQYYGTPVTTTNVLINYLYTADPVKSPARDDNISISSAKSTIYRPSSSLYEAVDDEIAMPTVPDTTYLSVLHSGSRATTTGDSEYLGLVQPLPASDK